jgi:hypothetical protein
MNLSSETNGETECEICVTPVDIAGTSPGTVIDESCKRWFVQESIFNPECTNKFEPEEGNSNCPICVMPVSGGLSPCSNCLIVPDQFELTFPSWDLYADPFNPPPAGVTFSALKQDVQNLLVSRISQCEWQGEILAYSAPYPFFSPPPFEPTFVGLQCNLYVSKYVVISTSGAGLFVSGSFSIQCRLTIILGGSEPTLATSSIRYASLLAKQISRTQTQASAGVCWPSSLTWLGRETRTIVPPTIDILVNPLVHLGFVPTVTPNNIAVKIEPAP